MLSAFWWLFCLVILFIYIISLRSTIFPATTGLSNHHHSGLTLDDLVRDENFQFVLYPSGATQFLLQVSDRILGQRGTLKTRGDICCCLHQPRGLAREISNDGF